MDKVPIEIISHIMQYLTLYDKENASLVCKKWYQAFIDPTINRNVIFRLRCDGDAKPSARDLEGIGRRKIRNLRICDTSDEVYNEVRTWNGYKSITSHITTIKMWESASTSAEVFLDILSHCPNTHTVYMYVHTLFSFLQRDTIRDKMLGVLTNLSKLILTLGSSTIGPKEIEYLMILPKVVWYVQTSGFVYLSKNITQEITFSLYCSNEMPISTLRLFSEKYDCFVNVWSLECNRHHIRLGDFLGMIRGFPKLKVESLSISLYSTSEVKDVNRLANVNVSSLNIRLNFNTNEWLKQNNLSYLITASPSLDTLSFPLSVEEGVLDCLLESLPFVNSIEVGQRLTDYERMPLPENERSRYIKAKFSTERDGKSKWLRIADTNTQKVLTNRPSLIFSKVHPNLQIFSLTGINFTLRDPNFISKLLTSFPGLLGVSLSFDGTGKGYLTGRDRSNQVDLNLFRRFEKLQALTLKLDSYLAKITLNGQQFPHLMELDLSGCVNLTDECLEEIGRSMPSLEYLDVSQCCLIGDVGLQSVLKSLTHLSQLRVIECKQVNSTTLKMISNCSSSLELLWVSFGECIDAIKEIHESSPKLIIRVYREPKW